MVVVLFRVRDMVFRVKGFLYSEWIGLMVWYFVVVRLDFRWSEGGIMVVGWEFEEVGWFCG